MFFIASKSLLDLTEADYYKLTSQDNYDDMKPSIRYKGGFFSMNNYTNYRSLSY